MEAAYASLENRKRVKTEDQSQNGTIEGQEFRLFSSDNVEQFYEEGDDDCRTKSVTFSCDPEFDFDTSDSDESSDQESDKSQIYAHLLLARPERCVFRPFPRPPEGNRRIRKIEINIKSTDGRFDMDIEIFQGKYLKLNVSSSFFFDEDEEVDLEDMPCILSLEFFEIGSKRDARKKKRRRRGKGIDRHHLGRVILK